MNVGTHPDNISYVIDLIYACAITPSRSDELLRGLAALFDAHFADSFSREHDGSHAAGTVFGLDRSDYQDGMVGTWSSRNPWALKAPVISAGEVRATWEFLSKEELQRSEMFVDYLNRRSLHEGMRFEIWSDSVGIEDISLLRSFSVGPFTTDEIALGRMLMPHLQRAAELRRRLGHAELRAKAGLAALDLLDHGVVLIDGASRVIHANPAAHALFQIGDAVQCSNGRLYSATASAARQFTAMLHRATHREKARAASVTLPRTNGDRALMALTVPIHWPTDWPQSGQPAAIVSFSRAHAVITERALQPISQVFGLTKAEAKLAAMLLLGQSPVEIADIQGRSVATIRTHLSRLMAKTGTTRQGELLPRLLELPRISEHHSLD